ncbi:MAG: DUF3712 domain-containing protein [Promethearchaeota archaeon]
MKLNKKQIYMILAIAVAGIITGSLGVYFYISKTSTQTIENTEISISAININSINKTSINAEIQGNVNNPSQFSADVEPILIDVLYKNVKMGQTQIGAMKINPGDNPINENCIIIINNQSAFDNFINDFVNKAEVVFSISGIANFKAASIEFTKNIEKDLSLNGLNNNLNVELEDFGILNATSSSFYANITLNITNPSAVSLLLENIPFDLYCNNTKFGNLTINSLQISTGQNLVNFIINVSISNITLFDNIADTLLTNKSVEIQIRGATSSENILNSYFSSLILNFTMQGIEPAECVILAMEIVNSTSNSITFDVDLQIYNPTSSTVSVTGVSFNASYKGEQFGVIDFNQIDVLSGTHEYNILSKLTFLNLSLLDDILSDYLDGKVVSIDLVGVSDGGNIIADIIDGFTQTVNLPTFAGLEYDVENLALLNSTQSTLILDADVKITNKENINVTIVSMILNVTFNNYWVGNLSISNQNVSAGESIIKAQIVISGEVNMTNVNKLLSNYLNKIDSPLHLEGNISAKLEGMTEPLNFTTELDQTLNGMSESLINSISLNFIVLSISPLQMSAYVNVLVNNPFAFDINITYLYTNVTFDDPDGCYIAFLANYPPRNEVFIDIVDKTYSTPIQIVASSNSIISETISTSNSEVIYRLYDEYYQDNDLLVDMRDGLMYVQIGDFSAEINFEFFDVPVPQ